MFLALTAIVVRHCGKSDLSLVILRGTTPTLGGAKGSPPTSCSPHLPTLFAKCMEWHVSNQCTKSGEPSQIPTYSLARLHTIFPNLHWPSHLSKNSTPRKPTHRYLHSLRLHTTYTTYIFRMGMGMDSLVLAYRSVQCHGRKDARRNKSSPNHRRRRRRMRNVPRNVKRTKINAAGVTWILVNPRDQQPPNCWKTWADYGGVHGTHLDKGQNLNGGRYSNHWKFQDGLVTVVTRNGERVHQSSGSLSSAEDTEMSATECVELRVRT
ncbi:hypothetical protein GGR50DRAFT_672410 [Xylaria sp. CBS 124048]|nr:hypothetical protein GGR50DRAFT_672410 [Xylaria sp. CBS 124048]